VTTTRDSPEGGAPGGTDAVRLVVRVWLPDRPGALGLVASRIGAIGADIVGVDVLERSEHVAVDEFAVMLDDADLVKLLVREIEEVDGASVEQWERVERFPDPLDALETMEHVCGASDVKDLADRLVARVRAEFSADWSAVLTEPARLLAADGDGTPEPSVLHALASGTSASPAVAAGDSGPDDLAVAPLAKHGAFLLVGRAGHPFRRRERRQLLALARVADLVSEMLA
jgi:ACT domain-containing protein